MTTPIALETPSTDTPPPPSGLPSDADIDSLTGDQLVWDTPPTPEPGTDTPDGDTPPEGEETPPADDAVTPEAFTIEVPLPDGEDGKRGGRLAMQMPTQEAADTIRFHVKQSAQVPRLQAQLQAREESETVLAFLDANPLHGMEVLADSMEDRGEGFVTTWARQNPMQAAQVLADLGFAIGKPDPVKAELLAARAESAALKAKEELRTARQTFASTSAQRAFAGAASEFVAGLKSEMGLGEGDRLSERFDRDMADAVAAVYRSNPRVTVAQVAAAPAVQEVVQEYAARRNAVAHPIPTNDASGQDIPRIPAGRPEGGQFAKVRVDTLRKVRGGPTTVPALTTTKAAAGATWYDLTKDA